MVFHTRCFRFITLLSSLAFLPILVWAQEPVSRFRAGTGIYAEIGGSAGLSFNLDQLIYENEAYKSSFRVGGGVSPLQRSGKLTFVPTLPVELLGFIGPGNKHFEFGGGYTHIFTSQPLETKSYYTGRLGFRYQKARGGTIFRLGIIPLLYQDLDSPRPGSTLSVGFGLSYGRSF